LILTTAKKLLMGIFTLILASGFSTPIFADSEISWNTDSHDYYHRDTIELWGNIYPIQENHMLVEIKNTHGENVFSKSVEINSNGKFTEDITILGDKWEPEGQFSVNLTHGDATSWMPIWIYGCLKTA